MLPHVGLETRRQFSVMNGQIECRLLEYDLRDALLGHARENEVSFAPGGQFFADRAEGDRHMRLNFAAHTPEEITSGIRTLGEVIRAHG